MFSKLSKILKVKEKVVLFFKFDLKFKLMLLNNVGNLLKICENQE